MSPGHALADRPRYERITEHPDTPASEFQLQCAAARYSLILSLSKPGDMIVEIGCGSGIGLNHLRDSGRIALGVDISLANLRVASRSAPVGNATAVNLPVRTRAAMVTALPEVIYYIEDQSAAIAELARVTARGGRIIVSWPDPRRAGFIPSPFATSYPLPADVYAWLRPWCSNIEMRGAFPSTNETRLISVARASANRLGLVPRTLHRRGQLKRLLGLGAGSVADLELDDACVPRTLVNPASRESTHVMLYAVGFRS